MAANPEDTFDEHLGQLEFLAYDLTPLYEAEAKARQLASGGGAGRAGGDKRTVVADPPQPFDTRGPLSRDRAAKAPETPER